MAYVYLVTDFLDEESLFFQFFFERIDLCLLICHFELLFDERAMLFENLLEQLRVHLVVPNALGFSLFVTHDEVGTNLVDVFSHESTL